MTTCNAKSYGYVCCRPAGHGDIHADPRHIAAPTCNLWVFEPIDEDERLGRKPASGYVLLTDSIVESIHKEAVGA